jgi:alkaline phosphatase
MNDESLKKDVPTLAEMSEAALQRLKQNQNGFVVQIEGGRVDHGAHANDLGALLFDQLAFDEAIGVALKFQEENPDTLVVITTDHGNANPGFQSGPGLGGNQFEKISRFKGTNSEHVTPVLNSREVTREAIKDRFLEVLDLELGDDEATMLRDFARGTYEPPYHRMNNARGMVGQIVARHLDFNWIGNAHSADYVELVAVGPGSEAVGPFNLNTDMFDLMVKCLGMEDAKEALTAAKCRGSLVIT